jgi:hypothetical protein
MPVTRRTGNPALDRNFAGVGGVRPSGEVDWGALAGRALDIGGNAIAAEQQRAREEQQQRADAEAARLRQQEQESISQRPPLELMGPRSYESTQTPSQQSQQPANPNASWWSKQDNTTKAVVVVGGAALAFGAYKLLSKKRRGRR